MDMFLSAAILFAFLSPAGLGVYAMWCGWSKTTAISRVLGILFVLTFVSLANMYVSDELPFALKGGGPDQGYVQDGHYFVGNHGRYTEVSQRFYRNTQLYEHISFWSAVTLLATMVVAIAVRVRWFSNAAQTGRRENN